MGRNAPFFCHKVKFRPFGGAEFSRSDKDKRGQPQGASNREIAFITIKGIEQGAYFLGIGDGGPVLDLSGTQSSAQVRRDIVSGSACGDGIAKNLPDKLYKPPGSFRQTFLLQGPDHGKNVLWFQLADGDLAEGREKIGVEPKQDMAPVFRRKMAGLVFIPFQGDIPEGIGLFRQSCGPKVLFMYSIYTLEV
jgi:hypothetical protein